MTFINLLLALLVYIHIDAKKTHSKLTKFNLQLSSLSMHCLWDLHSGWTANSIFQTDRFFFIVPVFDQIDIISVNSNEFNNQLSIFHKLMLFAELDFRPTLAINLC